MKEPIIIEDLNLDEALQKKDCITYGKINLMKKADTNSVFIPAIVICGAEEGPTFLVEACMHGEEYEGCEAILQMVEHVDTKKIRGKVLAIPALNLEAFMTGTRGAIHDYYGNSDDLNRVYPGRDDAFFTQYLAYFHLNNICDKIDYYLDFHGGGNYLFLQPETIVLGGDDEAAKKSLEMGKAFGANAIWYDVPGKFNGSEGCFDPYLRQKGIPGIAAEIGGQSSRYGFRKKNVDRLEQGIWNCMMCLDMIDGEPVIPDEVYVADIEYLHCHNGGVHYPQKEPLTPIKKGETLSIIKDVFGRVVEEIKAPYDGMIIGYWAYTIIQPRNHAYLYGRMLDM